MTTASRPENEFARSARAKKVAAFVAHFDAWVAEAGLDPIGDSEHIAETLRKMKPVVRIQHSIVCGQREPSETTWNALITVYLVRAAGLPEVSESLISDQDPFARFAS